MATNSKYQPALLGGVFIGVLSALPFINGCCCLWVLGGGALVTYLLQKNQDAPIETAQAVLGGLLAGLIGAVVVSVLDAILDPLLGPMRAQMMQKFLDVLPNVPPELREQMSAASEVRSTAMAQVLRFCVRIPTYAIFAMLGALLGVAMFRKKVTPPPQQASTGL